MPRSDLQSRLYRTFDDKKYWLRHYDVRGKKEAGRMADNLRGRGFFVRVVKGIMLKHPRRQGYDLYLREGR